MREASERARRRRARGAARGVRQWGCGGGAQAWSQCQQGSVKRVRVFVRAEINDRLRSVRHPSHDIEVVRVKAGDM